MKNNLAETMERYYRLHAYIYNYTRWSFLFGRTMLLRKIAAIKKRKNILEVGCGTGRNLILLAKLFPEAKITGIDISESMLKISAKKVGNLLDKRIFLFHGAYKKNCLDNAPYDLIIFSYALSMINPGWDEAIKDVANDLTDDGLIGAVDFYDSEFNFFKRWMGLNHVKMDGHLINYLKDIFDTRIKEIYPAYLGLWRWFLYVGQKK